MRPSLPVLLGLAAIVGYASGSASTGVIPTTDSGIYGVASASTCDRSIAKRQTAYFQTSNCGLDWPNRVDLSDCTHAVLTFAVFDAETFAVGMKNLDDSKVYHQFLQLPDKVHKGIAINGPTGKAWSNMSSTKTNRAAFIDSLKEFLTTWKFTLVEINWKLPDVPYRGATVADIQNEVDLILELREALGKDFGISVALPAQFEHLNTLHLKELQDAADWLTIHAKDLHGDQPTSPVEMDAALNFLWSIKLEPAKFNIGSTNYDENALSLGLDLADKHCLGGVSIWATDCDSNGASSQQPSLLDAAKPSLAVLPRSAPGVPGVPTDPISVTTSAQGTAVRPPPMYSKPPIVSSVAVSSAYIVSSVQVAPRPSSVVWSGQPTSQAASSQWASSVQAPVSPPSVQPPASPSSAAWSGQPSSQPGPIVVVPSHTTPSAQWSSVAPSSGAWSPPGGSSTPTSVGSSLASGTSIAWSSVSPPSSVHAPGSSLVSSNNPTPIQSSTTTADPIVVVPIPIVVPSSGTPSIGTTSSGILSFSTGSLSTTATTDPVVIVPIPIIVPSSSSPSMGTTPSIGTTPGIGTTPSGLLPTPTGTLSTATDPLVIVPIPIIRPSSGATPIGTLSTITTTTPGVVVPVPVIIPSSGATPIGTLTATTDPGVIVPIPIIRPSSGATPIGTLTATTDPAVIVPVPVIIPSSGATPIGTLKTTTTPALIVPLPIVMPSSGTPPGSIIPMPTGTLGSDRPVPTSTGCPKECLVLGWCKDYCVNWIFPRPTNEQPPHECLLPENYAWCYAWWVGPAVIGGGHRDPHCKPNDCIVDCAMQRIASFLFTKVPACFCVPKTCDKDSDSDSEDDNDPEDDPKPTSTPNEKNPKCKLLGCGCGYMGLPFGPGCPGKDFELAIPCGLFGCNPCIFFGCPGGTQPEGIIGYGGYCPGKDGCDPCPPELCSRPGCTIAGGCGPKPGPAPTKPPNQPDPEDCDDTKRTVVTDRFVVCTEGFDISALPSSYRDFSGSTSSTLVSSQCVPLVDVTRTICGPAKGYDTTTTKTGTNTLTSDAPACTRAPLSLDDDEGNNNPDEPLNTWTFTSNTTDFESATSKSSSSSSSKTSSSGSPSSTSSANPAPSHVPMDRNGHWTVEIAQYMYDDYSEIQWTLRDPNGFHAGMHNTHGYNKLDKITDYIQSVNRPFGDSMPFGVDMTVMDAHNRDHSRINFEIRKKVTGCDLMQGVECRPYMTTESYIEDQPFALQTCEESCKKNGKQSPLRSSEHDLWCDDLNKADWKQMWTGWKRNFKCGWKGFD